MNTTRYIKETQKGKGREIKNSIKKLESIKNQVDNFIIENIVKEFVNAKKETDN